MKRIQHITLLVALISLHNFGLAQKTISKSKFDELWNKADSSIKTGNTHSITKSLDAAEQDKINAIDVKEKKVVNPNYKPIDTSNLELFSTKPIINGVPAKENIQPKQAKIILPEKQKKTTETTKKIVTETKPIVKETKPITPEKNIETNKNTKPTSVTPTTTSTTKKTEDFSTKPIVKGKTVEATPTPKSASKYKIDTTKDYRNFTFDTKPIVNNNASYTRKDEPLPKSKMQIEEEIPVNRMPNNTNVGKDNAFLKEAYASYDREADSLHSANKKRLDSIMQALNIKVPVVINPTEYIDIFVSGGGTLKDNNAKQYDRIFIQNSGVIQREYKTKNAGVQRSEKKISKDELSKLAQYIVDMGFLDYATEYDCADDNTTCNQRFSKMPSLVPLEMTLSVGQRKNSIKVSIYAPETEGNLVGYPSNLEKIMKAIYTIVEK